MQTPTQPQETREPSPSQGSEAAGPDLPKIAAFAAAFAAAELALGILLGRFFDWGRAEALLFFAFRPWLLLGAALVVAQWRWRERLALYGLALLIAELSETLFLIGLGASNPWPEAARGFVAGALLVAVLDVGIQAARHFAGRYVRWLAGAGFALLFLLPGGLSAYERLAIGRYTAPASAKPPLMVATGLPLVWGEGGPLDLSSRPNAAFKALEAEFAVTMLDVMDGPSLAKGRLLLLAQPRALAPSELVALDRWVRNGGRALILTDPSLVWPSELPLGDIRRPPAIGLLGPLLSHWGLGLEPPADQTAVVEDVGEGAARRRLALFSPGRFAAEGSACQVAPTRLTAECRIGKGRAILLADADMMNDMMWVGPGTRGTERHARTSDNPLILADWLDRLGQVRRVRAVEPVEWLSASANRPLALLLAALPLLAASAPALFRLARRRRG